MLYRTRDKRFVCVRDGAYRSGDAYSLEDSLIEWNWRAYWKDWPWHELDESTLAVPKEFL